MIAAFISAQTPSFVFQFFIRVVSIKSLPRFSGKRIFVVLRVADPNVASARGCPKLKAVSHRLVHCQATDVSDAWSQCFLMKVPNSSAGVELQTKPQSRQAKPSSESRVPPRAVNERK